MSVSDNELLVLVTAGSKHGATAEIAERICLELRRHGHRVDFVSPDQVVDVHQYGAIVIGSAVYAGRWTKSARQLVDRIADSHTTSPIWIFSSGPLEDPPSVDNEAVDVAQVVEKLSPRDHRVFAGRADREALGFAERAILSAVKAQYGDYRNWEEISAWAAEIGKEILSLQSAA